MKLYPLLILTVFVFLFAQPPDVDPRYHTYQEVLSEVSALVDSYPDICAAETLGVSTTDSVPIVAVKLSDNVGVNEDESIVLLVGGQHANEPAGTETIMWLLHYLTANYDSDVNVTKWLDSLQIWFIPVDNPDGRQIVMNESSPHSLHWRKTTRDNNENGEFDFGIDGVDPNRNYDYKWDENTDTLWSSPNYKGPYPWSENEVVVVRDFVDYYRPTAVLDLHSPDSVGGNKLWFCWWDSEASTYHSEGFPHYYWVASELAENTETEVDGQYYESLAAYNTKPKLQLWTYWFSGCCSILMEITNQCFWTGDTVDTIAARVGRGIFYIFNRMFERGLVVKARNGSEIPIQAQVIIEGVTDTTFPPRLCNHNGRYHRFLDEGTYTVKVRYEDEELIFTDVSVEVGHNTYINANFTSIEDDYEDDEIEPVALMFASGSKIIVEAERKGVFKLYDMSGKLVITRRIHDEAELSTKSVPAGVYMAEYIPDDGEAVAKTITIVK